MFAGQGCQTRQPLRSTLPPFNVDMSISVVDHISLFTDNEIPIYDIENREKTLEYYFELRIARDESYENFTRVFGKIACSHPKHPNEVVVVYSHVHKTMCM